MQSAESQAVRGYHLHSPGHPRGVSCDAQGAMLGPIRLLAKTRCGFAPRPMEDLNAVLSHTFGQPTDCTGLKLGLEVVARALNGGNLARAMIATQLLHLPVLTEVEARRAAAMVKAAPDDPEHPGWPAGTEGGRGGQFRPKEEITGEGAKKAVVDRARRLAVRRTIRKAVRHLLSGRRLLRLAAETAADAIPVIDIAAAAATAADAVEMAEEFETLKTEADVALEFAHDGPYTLEQLRVSPEEESFSSYDAFRKEETAKRFGPAGDGYEYHHIVEQSATGEISAAELQSTRNIVRLPKLFHEEISAEYSDAESGSTIREALRGKSFEERWEQGLATMRKVGILH